MAQSKTPEADSLQKKIRRLASSYPRRADLLMEAASMFETTAVSFHQANKNEQEAALESFLAAHRAALKIYYEETESYECFKRIGCHLPLND